MRRPSSLLPLLLVVAAVACAVDDGVPTSGTVATTVPATIASTTTATSPAPSTTTTSATTTTTATSTTTTTMPPPLPLVEFELGAELVVDGLRQPVFLTAAPGDPTGLYVVEQAGSVLRYEEGTGEWTIVLDIEDLVRWQSERGMLGMAFHPDDPTRLFVHYSANDGSTTLEEFTVDPVTRTADRSSGRVLLSQRQPAGNHNGGMVAFGPDGYLYLGLGDGGGTGDPWDNGQNPFTILGAILRLDVDSGDPYAIPADNPFADGADGAPEVWAWGLRNPWRFTFDGTDLWVGDVGQDAWEEIDRFDLERPGDNGGWPLVEGLHCYRFADCDLAPFLTPVTEYSHSNGRCSVTGGVVYRGRAVPELAGTYLFGDFCSGEIWGLRNGDEPAQRLFTGAGGLPSFIGLTSFGVGPGGEVYVVQAGGAIWRLIPGDRQTGRHPGS